MISKVCCLKTKKAKNNTMRYANINGNVANVVGTNCVGVFQKSVWLSALCPGPCFYERQQIFAFYHVLTADFGGFEFALLDP
jgi:hypothetical protein